MKNKTITLAIAASVVAITLGSCRKEKTDVFPPASTLILGTWSIMSGVQDTNRNGSIDSSEIINNPPERENNFTFYNGGTGIVENRLNDSLTFSQAFSWSMQNDKKELTITANAPFTGTIEKLDNKELVIRYENGALDSEIKENFWLIFQKKQ